jgi:hypothetical protein
MRDHRWLSIRYVRPNGSITDLVQCEICGYYYGTANFQDITIPIPRGEGIEIKCDDWLVKKIMEA